MRVGCKIGKFVVRRGTAAIFVQFLALGRWDQRAIAGGVRRRVTVGGRAVKSPKIKCFVRNFLGPNLNLDVMLATIML